MRVVSYDATTAVFGVEMDHDELDVISYCLKGHLTNGAPWTSRKNLAAEILRALSEGRSLEMH